MLNRLYVGNLSYSTTDAELSDAFAPYGTVVSATVVTERDTGRSKGFGFIEMSTEAEADAAMNAMNGAKLGGRTIKVDKARPRTERGGGERGGGERRRSPRRRDYDDRGYDRYDR